ncbi:TPA: acyl-CoA thioesterase [Vibrio vulnificus]|uniref:acyl-CoA thioesterase n=1 Tax=Vibrio vulnificus TaxID=672 RepID=UPI001A26B298|nr:thioesterase family protein [Vibrio vulnificus]MCA0759715.1 acyl-CoA thioesterase [Vibrio vulnificus]MCA3913719.1 acyl-CoA thioesterase [Vibrio vulnificus]MCG6271678.1 acyl-CoA thioesterase [Vibrio vulnificus]MCG6312342.1 acyl-CoA thioesterase [Vibrio vulnificus]HAS6239917.1 acyl-CoA thioesterase [Vibrio vulnificus]
MELLLQDFPVVTEINVAWGEMDALQHINNVVYFRYFETARIEYFNKINLMDEIKHNQIGPVLSETQCRYRIPVTFPDTLLIGSRVSEVGEDRFTMEYQVVSKKMGKVTTTGSATVVMFDFKNQCKTQLPAVLRDAIFSIEAKKA